MEKRSRAGLQTNHKNREYKSQRRTIVNTMVGNHFGNTTKQIAGLGWTYNTMRLRLTSNSVSLQGSGPIVGYGQLRLCASGVAGGLHLFSISNLEPKCPCTMGSNGLSCLHVLRGYKQTNRRLVLNNQPTIQRDWNNKGTET